MTVSFYKSKERYCALSCNSFVRPETYLAESCTNRSSTSELKDRFPSMNVGDLGAGAHTPHDGWCDPDGLLWGFRRKAVELGATYIEDRFESAEFDSVKVKSLSLASGRRVEADAFVNATGAWSGIVAKKFGMKLPITPMRRFEHYFTAGSPVEHLPYDAPAAGRGIAELIVHGRYTTIDLTRLGYERLEKNEPYAEEGIL